MAGLGGSREQGYAASWKPPISNFTAAGNPSAGIVSTIWVKAKFKDRLQILP